MSDRLRDAVELAGSVVGATLDEGMQAVIVIVDESLGAADVGGVRITRARSIELLGDVVDALRAAT